MISFSGMRVLVFSSFHENECHASKKWNSSNTCSDACEPRLLGIWFFVSHGDNSWCTLEWEVVDVRWHAVSPAVATEGSLVILVDVVSGSGWWFGRSVLQHVHLGGSVKGVVVVWDTWVVVLPSWLNISYWVSCALHSWSLWCLPHWYMRNWHERVGWWHLHGTWIVGVYIPSWSMVDHPGWCMVDVTWPVSGLVTWSVAWSVGCSVGRSGVASSCSGGGGAGCGWRSVGWAFTFNTHKYRQ